MYFCLLTYFYSHFYHNILLSLSSYIFLLCIIRNFYSRMFVFFIIFFVLYFGYSSSNSLNLPDDLRQTLR